MIKLKDKKINGVYLGNKKINSVYLGNKKIYERNLFDRQNATENVALTWAMGNTFAESKSISSDFISVSDIKNIISNYWFYIFWYDENKTYLGNMQDVEKTSKSVPVQTFDIETLLLNHTNIKYFKIEYRTANNDNEDMTKKTDIILYEL